jgi:FemAB-related protein (PEP-CTERM system-associated)
MNHTIKTLTEVGHSAWDAYVNAHPQGSFFHLAGWATVIQQAWYHPMHYLACVDLHGQIQGILPLAELRSPLFGHHLKSLPGCTHAGVLANDDTAATTLIAAAEQLGKQLQVQSLELRHLSSATASAQWPKQDLYVRFRKPIADTPEVLLSDIPRKQRAEVRKGIAAGCKAEITADNAAFFALYADNVHRHGTPGFSLHYFDTLRAVFGQQVQTLIVKDASGTPVSGVLSFYYRGEVLPYYAGDTVAARSLSANDFKYYALMCEAAQLGVKVFDYGRSKVGTGPFHFKKNWGFTPEPLVYEYGLLKDDHIPAHNPLNPKYQLMIKTWRKLPRFAVNWLGPKLSRHLG